MYLLTLCALLALSAAQPGSVHRPKRRAEFGEKTVARPERSTTCQMATSTITKAGKNTLLAAHNRARGAVSPSASNMVALEWDEDLAKLAQYSANACVNSHGNDHLCDGTEVGQNMHMTTAKSDMDAVVVSWDSEKKDYTYSSNSCSALTCGHYTQVVWAKSVKVGCGYKECPTLEVKGQIWNNATLTFCNYSPRGNVGDAKPYKQGTSCTACDVTNGFLCDNGVCVNCLPSSDPSCQCTKTCQNGGTLNTDDCTCKCAGDYYGDTCASLCADGSPGCSSWKKLGYCDPKSGYYTFVTGKCPKACGLC